MESGFVMVFWFWFLVKNDRFSFDLEEIEIIGKVIPLHMYAYVLKNIIQSCTNKILHGSKHRWLTLSLSTLLVTLIESTENSIKIVKTLKLHQKASSQPEKPNKNLEFTCK